MVGGSELLYNRTLCKGNVVFVCRDYLVGILLCGALNHLEERRGHLLAINDECTTENFVAAVL